MRPGPRGASQVDPVTDKSVLTMGSPGLIFAVAGAFVSIMSRRVDTVFLCFGPVEHNGPETHSFLQVKFFLKFGLLIFKGAFIAK